ncbi:MAG: hypothetical protein KBC17_00155 [Candidatus Pacebacteria bacterium]|nr:hypothetical protein [Candidatus Paceibacterota bacterium]
MQPNHQKVLGSYLDTKQDVALSKMLVSKLGIKDEQEILVCMLFGKLGKHKTVDFLNEHETSIVQSICDELEITLNEAETITDMAGVMGILLTRESLLKNAVKMQ